MSAEPGRNTGDFAQAARSAPKRAWNGFDQVLSMQGDPRARCRVDAGPGLAAPPNRCFPLLCGGSSLGIVSLASSGKQANHADAQSRPAQWSRTTFFVVRCECSAGRTRVRWTGCGVGRARDGRGVRRKRRRRPIGRMPGRPTAMATLREGISLGTSPQRGGLRVLSSFALAAFSAPLKLAIRMFPGISLQSAAPGFRLPPSPARRLGRIGKLRPFSARTKALS